MASITASVSGIPFSGPFLGDANYYVTSSWPANGASNQTTALSFPNIDYPTVGKVVIQLSNTLLYNTSASLTSYVGLQESNDSVNWNSIAVFTASLLTVTDSSGTGSASSTTSPVQVLLTPNAKPYLRAQATVPTSGSTSGGITGSYALTALFATC